MPEKSIAVLYFENMNSEKESDYFCAGMTEDIITDLSKIKELKVVSRTDVLPFRNKEVNTRQVGDALRVNYILEGSVRKAGNRIRITAQLISVRDGYHLWAERFDRLVEDIFDLQNEVSQKIVDALKVSLTDSERQLLTQKPTDDLRAYDFYMRGRELLYLKGRRNTESAIKMFESAVAIDLGLCVGLRRTRRGLFVDVRVVRRRFFVAEQSDRDESESARRSSRRRLDAKFGIAMVYFNQRRFAESKRSHRRDSQRERRILSRLSAARHDCRTIKRSRRRLEALPPRGGTETLRRRRVDVSRGDSSKARKRRRGRRSEL